MSSAPKSLLAQAWDENADLFTNAVRITVSGLRKRLGEPWIIATVAGVGYRIDTQPDTGREGGERGIELRVECSPQTHPELRRLPHAGRFLMLAAAWLTYRLGNRSTSSCDTHHVRSAPSARLSAREQLVPPASFRSGRGHRAGVPAGIRSPGRVDSRRPDARLGLHHRCHTHGRDRSALPTGSS